MPTYRYLFYDLRTNFALGELPLKQVQFDRSLNQAGQFQGTIQLADPNVKATGPLAMTETGRTALYVERDGTLIWGGILWKTYYQSTDQTFQITAEDFTTYLSRRVLTVQKVYTNADLLSIAQDLIAYTKTLAGGDIGIQVGGTASSGVLFSQTWNTWDLKNIYEAIHDLSAVSGGFDYGIDLAYSSGVPLITLSLSYPRRGQTAPNTGLVWEFPGNVADYTLTEDATVMAETAYVTGSGSGTDLLMSSGSTPALLDNGYPLTEATFSHTDITDPNALALVAIAEAKVHAGPLVTPVLDVRAEMDPILGSYVEGDDARVRITDPRFPSVAGGVGLDTYYRIIKMQVTPQDDQGEVVELTMGPVP